MPAVLLERGIEGRVPPFPEPGGWSVKEMSTTLRRKGEGRFSVSFGSYRAGVFG
jgi:hypothetical protein